MKKIRHPFCTAKRKTGEQIVQSGLALTPADVLRAAEQGIPVSSSSSSNFIDGQPNPSWDIPLDEQRGIDIGHLWQEQMNAKKKFRAAHEAAQTVDTQN